MYGMMLDEAIKKIKTEEDVLVVVGAEKVPGFVYELADFNVSIGNQPHSEVAALAIFLDRYNGGRWQEKRFNGKMKIIPCNNGKKVISKDEQVVL